MTIRAPLLTSPRLQHCTGGGAEGGGGEEGGGRGARQEYF